MLKFGILVLYLVISIRLGKGICKTENLTNVHLNWFAPFVSGGGYCSEAIAFIFAANAVELKNITAIQHGDSVNNQYISSLSTRESLMMAVYKDQNIQNSRKSEILVNVCHSEPGAWYTPSPKYRTSQCPPPPTTHHKKQFNIGRTMFETDRLPSGWIDRLRYMDEIWVPTRFAKAIFVDGGMIAEKVRVIAEPVDCDFFHPFDEIVQQTNILLRRNTFDHLNNGKLQILSTLFEKNARIFLFVGKFEARKGVDILLRAYFNAFCNNHSGGPDVMLVIVTSSYHSVTDFEAQIAEIVSQHQSVGATHNCPQYMILSGVHQDFMPALYNLATALVIPSHGEGWGRPHMEAMSCGTPVVATNWSGPAAFVSELNGYPLAIEETLVDAPGWIGHKWAQPDERHLKSLLQHIASPEHSLEVREKGLQARLDMLTHYSLPVMGEVVRRELVRIRDSMDPAVDKGLRAGDDL